MFGVWSGGAQSYAKALREEYEAARGKLRARLEQCLDLSERAAIKSELEKLKKEFKTRLQSIGRGLFGAR